MICRKCGATLPDNTIRCSNCGIKVNMVCPECKTLVPFGEKFCTHCGFELIKICPSCHSSNAYYSTECRKCKTPLHQTVKPDLTKPDIIPAPEQELKTEDKLAENQFDAEVVEPISMVSSQVQYSDIPLSEYDNNIETEDETGIEPINEEQFETSEDSVLDTGLEESYDDIEEITADKTYETETLASDTQYEDKDVDTQLPIEQEISYEDENISDDINDNADTNEDEPKYIVKQQAVYNLINHIKTSINKHIIAVTGAEGFGKSAVLAQTKNILSNDGYICLYGGCSPLSQITSFGFFQDAFLRLLGFPPYRNSMDSFMKDFKKSVFNDAFNFLQPQELVSFLNLLYPTQKDSFENILENKQLMFSIIEKIIKAFLANANMIIIIDNFDLLDGASYDFINYIAGKNFFNNRLKLLVSYQENKPVENYFDIYTTDNIFETVNLQKFTEDELPDVISSTIGVNLNDIVPQNYIQEIIKRANGNAIRLEQDIAYLFDINYLLLQNGEIMANSANKPENEPESLEDLVKLRLNTLPAEVKNVLYMAAILGYRFASDVLCHAASMPVKKAFNVIELLKNELFIIPVDNFTCEFKSLAIWKLIYKEAQSDLLFKENSEHLYSVLKSRVLSSNIQKLISCSEALNKKEEFIIWQDTANISAKLGDTNLYVIAQKQCLKILEEEDMPNAENVREIIYEQVGKLLSEKSPVEAVGYLSNVLDAKIKASDTNKIIDLSGYFINSCYLTGKYFGAVEAVDAVITNLEAVDAKVSDVQLALIKTRKLEALLNIGNTEQIINLIKEDILIELNKAIAEPQTDTSYKNLLTGAWFTSNIVLAKAYAMQGNHETFAVTAQIKEFLENTKYKYKYYSAQTALIEAFAHSVTGETSVSSEILVSIQNEYKDKVLDKKLLCEWNLINIINRVFDHKLDGIKSELFELAEFANNINEHSVKNLVKLILGYIVHQEGNITKAINIYNDEITYFAKEKIAIGAMLSWALISRANIDLGDVDMALNTATKALEVAKGPKINNFFFIIYFQKLIAECYLLKGDLIAVKMYLEKALMLAKQENLKYQMVYLYMDYGRYMEEYMNAKQTFSEEYVKLTSDMYNKAVTMAKELKISGVIDTASKARSSFRTFCQLNAIEL